MKPSSNASIFLCIVVLITTVTPADGQDLLPALVRRLKPSAVAIETFDSRGDKLSRGSGFFIDSGRIVTNRRVIAGAYRAEAHSSTGKVYALNAGLASAG